MKNATIIKALFVASILGLGYSHQATQPHAIDNPKQLTVVFDLGGVLIDVNQRSALWQIGPRTMLAHFLRNRNMKMNEKLYEALSKIESASQENYGACFPDGSKFPALLAHWMRGNHTSQEIKNIIESEFKKHPEWFKNKQEKHMLTALIRFMLTPEKMAHCCQPIQEMVEFAKQCKEKGHRLCVLSNWDAESFALLEKKFPDLFCLFDEIIVSGKVNRIKPEQDIFSLITQRYPASSCIFIDDQAENISAARHAGMHGIHATTKNSYLSKSLDMQTILQEFSRYEQGEDVIDCCPCIADRQIPVQRQAMQEA